MELSRHVDTYRDSLSIVQMVVKEDFLPFPSRPNQMKTRYSLIRETEYSPSQR